MLVQCVQSGRLYPSAESAARGENIPCANSVAYSIEHGRPTHGLTFALVPPEIVPAIPPRWDTLHGTRRADGRVIHDLDTGRVYGTCQQLGDDFGVYRSCVLSAIRSGHCVAGHRIALIDVPPLPPKSPTKHRAPRAHTPLRPIRDLSAGVVYPDPRILAAKLRTTPAALYQAAKCKGVYGSHRIVFADKLPPGSLSAGVRSHTYHAPDGNDLHRGRSHGGDPSLWSQPLTTRERIESDSRRMPDLTPDLQPAGPWED